MKRILIYNIVGAILPLLILSLMVSIHESNEDIGYVSLFLCLESILFFNGLLVNKYRFLFIVILVITVLGSIFANVLFDNPLYVLLGILFSGVLGYISSYRRILYALGMIFIYPTVFISFGINNFSIISYAILVLMTLLFSFWLKYRKVKIYLYDNY